MKKYFSFLLLYTSLATNIFAQTSPQQQEDSILKVVNISNDVSTLCDGYLNIAKLYTGQNPAKEKEYLNKTIFKIEQSRNRKLIADYYRKVADQWNSVPTPERQILALQAIDKGIQIAKEAQLNKESAILLVRKAITFRNKGDLTEALKCNEESISYASLSKSDSVIILCEISHASTLLEKDENLSAFKKYMHALNLAEIAKDEKFQITIQKRIGDFYWKVDQIEKAKDYYMKGLNLAKKLKDSAQELSIYQSVIGLYVSEKDFASAREYLKILKQKEKESSFYKRYAISAESSIIAQEDIKKLPEYVRQNKEVLEDYVKYGMQSELDRLKAVMFTVEKKNDSASYYFMKAKQTLNPANLMAVLTWNQSYAYYLEQTSKYMEAAKYLDKNLIIAKKMQSLTFEKTCYEYLDSMYIKAGNKEQEVTNKLLLFSIKDSLNKQQKANDLLGVEIDIENKETKES